MIVNIQGRNQPQAKPFMGSADDVLVMIADDDTKLQVIRSVQSATRGLLQCLALPASLLAPLIR